ncbi:MAG: orotate phosphoribosyltransferase [Clostridiales bacterium]|jgi:orotate phosphoribosyltransferase|nr:orotate phosphoribosyltransferase [Clostridiales bacterium]
MEQRSIRVTAKRDKRVAINVIPGHFATNHSHVNYYVDMTDVKCQAAMAKAAAALLADTPLQMTPVDTIICLEGTEVLGAFLADWLSHAGTRSPNAGGDINLITPERNANNQMIFRDNLQPMVWNKNILLLIASASTGKTINRSMECLQYYGGALTGIAAVFSAITEYSGVPVYSLFTRGDIPDYTTCPFHECAQCREGRKIDALVNSYGYSRL